MEYLLIKHSLENPDHFESLHPAFVVSYSPGEETELHIKIEEESQKNEEYNDESGKTFSVKTENNEAGVECKLKLENDHIDTNDHSPISSKAPVSLSKRDGKPAYTCEICGKSFSRQSNLKSHNKRIHIGERPYACSSCGKSFKTTSERAKHEIIHGQGDKPYKCDKCSRSFHCPAALVQHDYIHTGISKHYCDQCGMCFSCKKSVERHKSRTHGAQVGGSAKNSDVASKLECGKCGKFFKQWKEYEAHCNFHCYYKVLEVVRAQKLGLKKEAT